jgi:hypothetical protein
MNQGGSPKKIILIGGAAVVIVVLAFLILLLGKTRTYEYKALVAPVDSTFTIDGRPAKAGKIKLSKGRHTLKATRELFEGTTVIIDTKDLYPGQAILVLPKAVTAEAKKWLEDHPDTTGVADEIGAVQVTQRSETIDQQYPVVQNLPYTTLDYKIDYAIDDDLNISFTITLYPYAKPDDPVGRQQQLKAFKTKALGFLSGWGIHTDSVPITYVPAEAANL